MKKIIQLYIIFTLFVLPSCKKSEEEFFDITGTWDVEYSSVGQNMTGQLIFTGSKITGTVTEGIRTGKYLVSRRNVSFTFTGWSEELQVSFTQFFEGNVELDKNSINGDYFIDYDQIFGNDTGKWRARR